MNGCAGFSDNVGRPVGPPPQIHVNIQDVLLCVSHSLSNELKNLRFTVFDVVDKTGKANFNGSGDATGAFTTQGPGDMIILSLSRTGVKVTETGEQYRHLIDWVTGKSSSQLVGDGSTNKLKTPDGRTADITYIPLMQGVLRTPRYGITGAITAMDFAPGGGIDIKLGGYGGNYSQNRVFLRIDLRVVELPYGNAGGGDIVATTTVLKEITQDNIGLSIGKFFNSSYVSFDIGGGRREPLQDIGVMIDYGVADLLEQLNKNGSNTRSGLWPLAIPECLPTK